METQIRKQKPHRLPLAANQILVTRYTHFSVYMKRIHTLLFNIDKKWKEESKQVALEPTFTQVYLQGMGAAIQKTVDLALQFQETYGGDNIIELETTTFTVPVHDLLLGGQGEEAENPLAESEPEVVGEQTRLVSGICVCLTRRK